MSVNSIVDLHRNLKKAAAGAAKAANARNEKAKGYLNDIRNMETRLQEIRERKQAKLQENAQSEEPVKEPVEKAAPAEVKVPETKPEPVKAEAPKTEERPAEEKKEQAPVQEAPEPDLWHAFGQAHPRLYLLRLRPARGPAPLGA